MYEGFPKLGVPLRGGLVILGDIYIYIYIIGTFICWGRIWGCGFGVFSKFKIRGTVKGSYTQN